MSKHLSEIADEKSAILESRIVAIVGTAAFLVFFSYFVWFWLVRSFVPGDADSWAQFGDYFGGVINPVAGIATAFLVVLTLRTTRREAADTRAALEHQRLEMEGQTKLLNEQAEAAGQERLLAERRKRLEGLLAEWNLLLDQAVSIPMLAGNNSTTFREFFHDPHSSARVAKAMQQSEWRGMLDHHSVRFSEVLYKLDEFALYIPDYEKHAENDLLSTFYKARTNSAARILSQMGILEGETARLLTVSRKQRAFG